MDFTGKAIFDCRIQR